MTVTLDSLELTPAELEACHDAIRKQAYCHWLDAGSPPGDGAEFWLQAERQWIEHCYVPNRQFDGSRPQTAVADAGETCCGSCQTPQPKKGRRHANVSANA